MSGHTPGPWGVRDTPYPSMIDVRGPDGKKVAGPFVLFATNMTWQEGDEQRANARLIAAAPDLLDVATEIANEKCRDYERTTCLTNGVDPSPCLPCRARAAIARATGGEP